MGRHARTRTLPWVLFALTLGASAHAEARKGWLGVALEATKTGVRVQRVLAKSPAELAGVRAGDVVRRIDEKAVSAPTDVTGTVAKHAPGDTVLLTLVRDKIEVPLRVKLTAKVRAEDLAGKFLPGLDLETVRGDPVTSEALRGKVSLVYVFATWCGSCRATMPRVSAWQTKFAGRGFRAVGVGVDGKGELDAYAKENDLKFSVGVTQDALTRFGVESIPTLFLVDRRGMVRDVVIGAEPSGLARIEASLETLLGEPTSL